MNNKFQIDFDKLLNFEFLKTEVSDLFSIQVWHQNIGGVLTEKVASKKDRFATGKTI